MKSRIQTHTFILAVLAVSLFSLMGCTKAEVNASASVSGFSPSSGPTGTIVIITGTNFSTVISNNVVKFNGVVAAVSAAAVGQLTATCPSGATSGKITVTVAGGGGTATSSSNYTVTP